MVAMTSWNQYLAKRAPMIILGAGYLFCAGIFLATGFTWFVKTDMYVSAKCRIVPQSSRMIARSHTVVLKFHQQSGSMVKEGDALADVITQPTSIAYWTLREYLNKAMAEIPFSTGKSIVKLKSEVSTLLARIPADTPTEILHSPADGWFLSSTAQMVPTNTPRSYMKGDSLFEIAALKSATMEVSFTPKGRVTIAQGDFLEVRIPEFEPAMISGKIDHVHVEADALIPLDKLHSLESHISVASMTSTVQIDQMEVLAVISREEKLHRIHLEIPKWQSSTLLPVNGRPASLVVVELGNQTLTGTWSDVHARVSTLIDLENAPQSLADALSRNLGKAQLSLEMENCWARTGVERLFLRLFKK